MIISKHNTLATLTIILFSFKSYAIKYDGRIKSRYIENSKFNSVVDTATKSESLKLYKAVFGQLLGNGVFFSINYDTRFTRNKLDGFGCTIGVGKGTYFPEEFINYGRYTTIPMAINYLYGNRRSSIELGFAVTPHFTFNKRVEDKIQIIPLLNIGYRYKPLRNGVFGQLLFTPGITKDGFKSYGGASLGYGFK